MFSRLRGVRTRLYYEGLWALGWLDARTRESVTASVGGVTATFGVPTTQEAFWLRNLDDEEAAVREDVVGEVRDGDVFWDGGANIGLVSCFAGGAATVEVVAFEPFPENARKLRDNLERNGLAERATVREVALGAATGTGDLAVAENWDTMHSLAGDGAETIEVAVVRGDELVDVSAPDVLKIDVEGAERDVLDGLGSLLGDCRTVYCEVHDARGVDGAAIRGRLEREGFTVSEITADENTTNLVARR